MEKPNRSRLTALASRSLIVLRRGPCGVAQQRNSIQGWTTKSPVALAQLPLPLPSQKE